MSDVLFRPYNMTPEEDREPLVFTPNAQPQYGPARWPEGPAEFRRGTRPPVNIEDLPPPEDAIFTPAVQPGGTDREQRSAFSRLAEFLGLRRSPEEQNTIEMQGPGIGTAAEALFTAGEDLFMQVANAGPARIREDYSLGDKLRDTGSIARELFNVTRFGDETPYETPYPEATPAERLFSGMIDPTDAARFAALVPSVVRRAMGRISGVTDEAGEAMQVFHGTNVTYDVPQPGETGIKGAGFYFTNNPEDAAAFARETGAQQQAAASGRFLSSGDGEQIRPGILGGKIFDGNSNTPITGPELQKIIDASQGASSRVADIVRALSDQGSLVPSELMFYLEQFEAYKPGVLRWLEDAGYVGVVGDYNEGVLFNPALDYIAPWDTAGMRAAIERNQNMFTPEELNTIYDELNQFEQSIANFVRQTPD